MMSPSGSLALIAIEEPVANLAAAAGERLFVALLVLLAVVTVWAGIGTLLVRLSPDEHGDDTLPYWAAAALGLGLLAIGVSGLVGLAMVAHTG